MQLANKTIYISNKPQNNKKYTEKKHKIKPAKENEFWFWLPFFVYFQSNVSQKIGGYISISSRTTPPTFPELQLATGMAKNTLDIGIGSKLYLEVPLYLKSEL